MTLCAEMFGKGVVQSMLTPQQVSKLKVERVRRRRARLRLEKKAKEIANTPADLLAAKQAVKAAESIHMKALINLLHVEARLEKSQ